MPIDHVSIGVRATPSMLIPYYKMKIDRLGETEDKKTILPIEKYVLGPHPDNNLLSNGMSYAIHSFGIAWKGMEYSKCPYRSV